MKKENYSYTMTSSKAPGEIFNLLLDIKKWWHGLYAETLEGKSSQLNDEFSFKAGDGVHYSKQKLVELVPGKSLAWLVTDSRLSFPEDPAEWTGTTLRFELSEKDKGTEVRFTHEGLTPQLTCYNDCSGAWTGYMANLEKALK